MAATRLSELAKTIRSKNAGVDKITFDIIFRDRANYERVKRARVLTRETMAALYRIPAERISDFVEYRSRIRDQIYDLPADAERQRG